MWCYRRHGHNEGDDPSYTQPLMYKAIAEHRSVRKLYVETLVKRGDITLEEAEQALDDFQASLQVALDETRAQSTPAVKAAKPPKPPVCCRTSRPASTGRSSTGSSTSSPTIRRASPVHPKLAKQFEARTKLFETGEVDWATAESLAFGSLLLEGHRVRLAGEDSRVARSASAMPRSRNTTGEPWIPLADLEGAEGNFWVYDSLLSEYAALGFEYGYARRTPRRSWCGRRSSATSSTAPR